MYELFTKMNWKNIEFYPKKRGINYAYIKLSAKQKRLPFVWSEFRICDTLTPRGMHPTNRFKDDTFGISHRFELNCFSLPPSLRESVPFNFCIRFVFRFHDQITSNLIFWNVWTFRSIARVHSLEYICIEKCGGDARYTKAKIHAITIGCVCGWFP